LRVFFVAVGDSRGAAVNDSPGDCQSRDRARPQAGESPLEHHNSTLILIRLAYYFFAPRSVLKRLVIRDF